MFQPFIGVLNDIDAIIKIKPFCEAILDSKIM